MTSDTLKPMLWSGGEHVFNLNHPWVRNVLSIRGLPGDFGSTPAACFKRFNEGTFAIDDVERVIELGLIGGGMSRQEADDLVERFVRRRPVLENQATAVRVIMSLFTNPEQPTGDQTEIATNG